MLVLTKEIGYKKVGGFGSTLKTEETWKQKTQPIVEEVQKTTEKLLDEYRGIKNFWSL